MVDSKMRLKLAGRASNVDHGFAVAGTAADSFIPRCVIPSAATYPPACHAFAAARRPSSPSSLRWVATARSAFTGRLSERDLQARWRASVGLGGFAWVLAASNPPDAQQPSRGHIGRGPKHFLHGTRC